LDFGMILFTSDSPKCTSGTRVASAWSKSARRTSKVRIKKHGAQKKTQVFWKTYAFGNGCILSEYRPLFICAPCFLKQ